MLDLAALIGFSAVTAAEAGALEDENQLMMFVKSAAALGFGMTIQQLFLVPLMPLYSYSRIPKSKTFGLLIPVIGIALIFLLVLEFIHLGLALYIPQLKATLAEKLDDPETQQMVTILMSVFSDGSIVP